MGLIFGDKPPEPPKEQKNWFGGVKVDRRTGMPLTKKVTAPGGILGLGRTIEVYPKQKNAINNLRHQLSRHGGRIDDIDPTPEGVVTCYTDSHGQARWVRHDSQGNNVGEGTTG